MSKREGQAGAPKEAPALVGFGAVDMTLYNAMLRNGITSVGILAGEGRLPSWIDSAGYAEHGWAYLLEIRTIGPVRVLRLVNWLRDNDIELSWFADWDNESRNWDALANKWRSPSPLCPGTGRPHGWARFGNPATRKPYEACVVCLVPRTSKDLETRRERQ